LTAYTEDDDGIVFHWKHYGDERFVRLGQFLTIPDVLDGNQWRNKSASDEDYFQSREKVTILKMTERRRKNLLIVRSGRDFEPFKWIDFGAERDFDVMVSAYHEDALAYKENVEHCLIGGQSKFESIKETIEVYRDKFDYSQFCVMDGDIIMDGNKSLENLFQESEYQGIALGQPSLTHHSFYSHVETLNCPSFICRYTNFVEVMTPVFSADAFWTLLPTFSTSISTWGVDFLWPQIIGVGQRKIGIIDSVSVVHSKPIDMSGGAFYAHLKRIGIDAALESNRLISQFKLDTEIKIEGAVARNGDVITRSNAD